MLTIRFLRQGKKNQPFFGVVVTDKRNAPRGGKFIEKLGYFNPLTKEVSLKKERIEYWLKQGAKCSDTVHNLLIKENILEGKKISVHKKAKEKGEKEKTQEEKTSQKPEEQPKPEEKTKDQEEKKEVVAEEEKEKGKEIDDEKKQAKESIEKKETEQAKEDDQNKQKEAENNS